MTGVSTRLAAFAIPAVGTFRNRAALFLLLVSALTCFSSIAAAQSCAECPPNATSCTVNGVLIDHCYLQHDNIYFVSNDINPSCSASGNASTYFGYPIPGSSTESSSCYDTSAACLQHGICPADCLAVGVGTTNCLDGRYSVSLFNQASQLVFKQYCAFLKALPGESRGDLEHNCFNSDFGGPLPGLPAPGSPATSVPNVVGTTQAAASSAIDSANLQLGTVTTASSNSVPSGSVISENPTAGTSVSTGSSVDLVISTGVATANVCPGGQTTPTPCTDTITAQFNVPEGTTLGAGSVQVVTQGAPNLDFILAAAGTTCTSGLAGPSSCAVNVTFAPLAPGLRMGAVNLTDSSGNPVASSLIDGIGNGPAIAFGPGVQTTVGSGYALPYQIAVDGAGDVFIADSNNNQVVEITPGGVQTTVSVSGLTEPAGVAVDGAGDLFIANGDKAVVELTPNGVQTTVPTSGLGFVNGLAVDGAGDVFISDPQNNRVVEVTPSGVQTTVPATGLNYPTDVAVDGAGDVFIADSNNNQVVEVTPGGVQTTVPASGLNIDYGVTVDAAGDVFIVDSGNDRVVEVPAGGGPQTTVISGLTDPLSALVTATGDLFIMDTYNNQVLKLQRSQAPSLTFASTGVGSASSDSPQSVTLQNIGNQQLNAVAPGLVVAGPDFVQVGGSGTFSDCSNSFALAPASACNRSINFVPQSATSLSSAAVFTDNALNASPSATQAITLQGTGTQGVQTITFNTPAPPSAADNSMFTVAASASSGLPVAFTSSGSCTNSGATYTMTSAAGSCSVIANQDGNTNYSPAAAVTETVTQPLPQTIAFSSSAPASAAYNNMFTVAASASSGLPAAFTSSGSCSNVGATYTMTSGTGSCSVIASQAGNGNYSAAPAVSESVAATPASQTIAFTIYAPASAAYNSMFTVAASASSGLPVAYTSSGPCSNADATYTMTRNTGTCSVIANQAGNGNYAAAPSFAQSVTATVASQSIAFTTNAPASAAYSSLFTVKAKASSGLTVAYTSSGSCTNSGATYTMTGTAGTCSVIANQAGNSNYSAAPAVTESVSATPESQAITFTANPPASSNYNSMFTVAAGASSGLTVAFTSSGSCTNLGGTYTMTSGTGTCSVIANQAGGGNYSPAPAVTHTVNAAVAAQTITFTTNAPASAANLSSFAVAAGASSGLPVAFTSSGACTNMGATYTMTKGTGTCSVIAKQSGNSDYSAAPTVTETSTTAPASQTTMFTTPAPASAAYNSKFTVAASASSGLTAAFTSSGSCSNSGATYTMTSGTGTCSVIANQAGNNNYSAAPTVTETVNAISTPQTITFNNTAPASKVYLGSFTVVAKANSSLAVTFTSSGSCTNSGAIYTMTSGNGTCSVIADQAGNGNYLAAPTVTEVVNATPAAQTITFTTLPPGAVDGGGSVFTVAAGATSMLPVTFTSAGACTNVGATHTVTSGSGKCSVIVSQAGNGNYTAAPTVTKITTVLVEAKK